MGSIEDIALLLERCSESLDSDRLRSWLQGIAGQHERSLESPYVKRFPDTTFLSFHDLGVDFVFDLNSATASDTSIELAPISPSADDPLSSLQTGELSGSRILTRVDIYNPPENATSPRQGRASRNRIHHRPAPTPITMQLPDRQEAFLITSCTTGADFVRHLGEPTRKGGGNNWIPPWLEWERTSIVSDDHDTKTMAIMIELRPSKVPITHQNPQQVHMPFGGIWEAAKAWEWGCLKVFRTR